MWAGDGGESAREREWEREREGWRERKKESERVNKCIVHLCSLGVCGLKLLVHAALSY